MTWTDIIGFLIVLISAGLLASLAYFHRKSPPTFRELSAFRLLRKAIGLSVEEGSRLHVSLGRGGVNTPQWASALAGLATLLRIANLASAGDRPPVATCGDGALSILAQDTLQVSYQKTTSAGQFDSTNSRLTGLTPFSYVAGAIPIMHDEQISTSILIGNFGIEAGLMTDAAERQGSRCVAASDNLSAQAVLYASTQDPLIGEELYAAGAYTGAGIMHAVSLHVQDILRWLIVAVVLIGILIKLTGLL